MEFADCKNFADICKVMGRNVNDYYIAPGFSTKEKANMYHSRLMLIAKCANGNGVVDLTDPEKVYYTPHYYKTICVNGFLNFSLTYDGCEIVDSDSNLGARPPFLQRNHAVFVGKTFVSEFESWLYYLNKAYQEI